MPKTNPAPPAPQAIAIAGCGTVGSATAQLLQSNIEALNKKTGLSLKLKYIVDIDFTRAREARLNSRLFSKDLSAVLKDPEILIIVETVGGLTIARNIIEQTLKAGKHVVTANKALLAHHGQKLFQLARENKCSIGFEASCGGGIPIIRALVDGLLANENQHIYGIVNGTSNFILTRMMEKNQDYKQALQLARENGLAEADPSLDVNGMDTAHKICLLAGLAFGKQVELSSIPVQGIESIHKMDVEIARKLGYIIKLLAQAHHSPDGLEISVCPGLLPINHPLAQVSGPFNAISVYSDSVGHTMYYGQGAGGKPTASAVVSDILSISLGTWPKLFSSLKLWPHNSPKAQKTGTRKSINRHYIRLMSKNESGVIAQISTELAKRNISINSLFQHENSQSTPQHLTPIAITTHPAPDKDIEETLKAIQILDTVSEESMWMHIIKQEGT